MKESATLKSLELSENIYHERISNARELKKQGSRIIGYMGNDFPVELLTAAGLIPFRITGSPGEVCTMADGYVESILCPYVRSCFDKALRGEYDFLDGFVVAHSCDNIQKIYDIWRSVLKPRYKHFVNVPHSITESSVRFFKQELARFRVSLEKSFETVISDQKLHEAIKLHNENRSLVRELYGLRKPDPPLIKGSEVTRILVAIASIPVEEANGILRGIIGEVGKSGDRPNPDRPRILVQGAEIDDSSFMEMLEGLGANIVVDDMYIGTKAYWHDMDITPDPLDGLVDGYLARALLSPRMFQPREGRYEQDLESRFGHLRKLIEEFSVDGVILDIVMFCDTFAFDVPDVRHFLESQGVPVLYLEDFYNTGAMGQLKTRVQAFLEMIG